MSGLCISHSLSESSPKEDASPASSGKASQGSKEPTFVGLASLLKGKTMDEDCCNSLESAARIIAQHLKESYNDQNHKNEIPTCITCMAFFLGTQNADALSE